MFVRDIIIYYEIRANTNNSARFHIASVRPSVRVETYALSYAQARKVLNQRINIIYNFITSKIITLTVMFIRKKMNNDNNDLYAKRSRIAKERTG